MINDNIKLIIIIFIITLIIYLSLNYLLEIMIKRSTKTKTKLDDYIIRAIIKPLRFSVFLIFIYIGLLIFQKDYSFINQLLIYTKGIFIVVILWFILKLISEVENYLVAESTKIDADIVRLLSKLAKAIVIVLLSLSALQFFGVSITSILAFGGVGGMVIGFAAKDMLTNIVGGLMISLDKPFSIGDWIRVGNIEGTVENIGWRMTRIRTFSKNPIYVPNSVFTTQSIETPSRMTHRRILETIGISYDDIKLLPKVIDTIENYLKNNDKIDKKTITMVYFNHFNDSSLDVVVYAFTKTTNVTTFKEIKSKILLDIAKIIDDIGASIAYPTHTILTKTIDK